MRCWLIRRLSDQTFILLHPASHDPAAHLMASAAVEWPGCGLGTPAVLATLPAHAMPVIAEQTIRYLLPLSYPATIEVGTAVTRIGRTSYDVGHTIFLGDRCAATGILIYVLVDAKTGRGMPLPEAFRAGLEGIRLKPSS